MNTKQPDTSKPYRVMDPKTGHVTLYLGKVTMEMVSEDQPQTPGRKEGDYYVRYV